MKTTADYLDALRAHFNAPSDYALEKHTGWKRQYISRYRRNRISFDDTTAEKVARWLSVPLARVLIDMNAQRAKSERVKRAWEKIAATAASVAVLGFVALPWHEALRQVCILCQIPAAAPLALCILSLIARFSLRYSHQLSRVAS